MSRFVGRRLAVLLACASLVSACCDCDDGSTGAPITESAGSTDGQTTSDETGETVSDTSEADEVSDETAPDTSATDETPTPADTTGSAVDGAVVQGAAPLSTGATFEDAFDGAPSSPTPWASANWDVTVHSRDMVGPTFDPMQASHGPDCAGPPATHEIALFEEAVFLCRDHLMTAINAVGYGLIYLTPDHLVDFSAGEAVITVDVSTLRTSTRDWWDIWITPYEDETQLVGEDWYPDLNGPPRRAVHIEMIDFNSTQTGFLAEVFDDFRRTDVPGDTSTAYETVLTPDAARRDTFELRISENHLKFGMPGYGLWWIDTPISNLGWDQGVVQFGHHSYNPTKDDVTANAHANTWHWDNVRINPAAQFTMLHANRRAVSQTDNQPVTFATPAPADSILRFAGYDPTSNIEFSSDGGNTWTTAEPRETDLALVEGHHASFETPVAEGATEIRFRGQNDWSVRDISIWSRP